MDKIKKYIKENKGLCLVLLISLILHIITLIYLGPSYTINSDDARYIKSGFVFKEKGVVSIYSEYPTAQIMPGLTYIIGLISLIFGEGTIFYLVLKLIWMIFALFSIVGIYKTVLLLCGKKKHAKLCATLSCLPLLLPSFLWMDNVILTETPYMMAFIFVIYYTLKEGQRHEKKNFVMILLLYMFATLLRANFAIYPLLLIAYLLMKKYDWKLMLKEIAIAAFVMSLFFVPWIIRNYNLFHEFIPLTYGSGNPKYWGTYQGYGFPSDEELDFDGYLSNYDDENLHKFINGEIGEELSNFYSLKLDKVHADYRMNAWWQKDKLSFLVSYAILKPIRLMAVFYWEDLFGINNLTMQVIRGVELLIFVVAFITILVKKKINKEIIFLLSNFILQVVIYSWNFTFSRYGQTLVFLLFIVTGYGLNILLEKRVKKM